MRTKCKYVFCRKCTFYKQFSTFISASLFLILCFIISYSQCKLTFQKALRDLATKTELLTDRLEVTMLVTALFSVWWSPAVTPLMVAPPPVVFELTNAGWLTGKDPTTEVVFVVAPVAVATVVSLRASASAFLSTFWLSNTPHVACRTASSKQSPAVRFQRGRNLLFNFTVTSRFQFTTQFSTSSSLLTDSSMISLISCFCTIRGSLWISATQLMNDQLTMHSLESHILKGHNSLEVSIFLFKSITYLKSYDVSWKD